LSSKIGSKYDFSTFINDGNTPLTLAIKFNMTTINNGDAQQFLSTYLNETSFFISEYQGKIRTKVLVMIILLFQYQLIPIIC
jgi:hypothetical protein